MIIAVIIYKYTLNLEPVANLYGDHISIRFIFLHIKSNIYETRVYASNL